MTNETKDGARDAHSERSTGAMIIDTGLRSGSELDLAAKELLEAAMRYWEAFRRETGGAAVVWLTDVEGRMVMLTRGEYRDTLMRNVHQLPRDTYREFGS